MSRIKLNPEQKRAVNHGKGPLLIIAGAGTGKTTVITQRIKNLILKEKISTNSILVLTFTNKASFEMQERVDQAMPYGYSDMWINTFHSFCDRILKDEAINIGLDPNYNLMSESESILLLKKNIFDIDLKYFRPLSNPTKFLEALLIHFSRLKDEDISPKDYEKFAKKKNKKISISSSEEKIAENEKIQELSTIYSFWEKLKIDQSVMDFSDLISNTLILFRNRSDILKKYQTQFQHILVDEFQDTNYAQNELAMLLSGDDQNITVVADDDQAIYRWRGAAISNVVQFKKNFKKAKIITLTQNYRSTQSILDYSYKMIQHNNPNRLEVLEKIDKHLNSARKKKGSPPNLIHTERVDEEAESVTKKIEQLVKKGHSYNSFAILVRANNHARPFTEALSRRQIPYQFLGPGYLFHQEEVKDLIAYLKVLSNLADDVSLYRILNMDIFDISPISLNYLLNSAKKKNAPLFEVLDQPNEFITGKTLRKIKDIKKMIIKHTSRIKKNSAGQILYDFLIDSGLYEKFAELNSLQDEKRALNIAKFFDRIKSHEAENETNDIHSAVGWIDLMMEMGESPLATTVDWQDYDAVNILSVHSSKGLEFPIVFVVNLVSDRFPTRQRREKIPIHEDLIKEILIGDDFHQQEERRLFYVAMTRARDKLFLTASNYYGAGKRVKKLSPFLYEVFEDLKDRKTETKKIKKISLTEATSEYGSAEEKLLPIQPHKITRISYSNLQMFDICPLHYKAKVILGVPTPVTHVQSFGISIHNALHKFYEAKNNDSYGLSILKKHIKEEWINEGYDNKAHETKRYKEALSIIRKYYKKFHNPQLLPVKLEFPFSFFLKNGVKVIGKIDRIDSLKNDLEIIDYKTGSDNPKAHKAHEYQLAIYALAATKVKHPIFDKKVKDITLSLIFLGNEVKKSIKFNSEQLNDFEDKLIDQIKKIESSDFKCSKSILCHNCEYKMLCNVKR